MAKNKAAAAEAASDTETEGDASAKSNKSIVPAKYGNKYKNGGSDALATFINDQCTGKDGFEYTSFFDLCRKNGLPEDKVSHYQTLVGDNVHGAPGSARMTLRNMLETVARKNGKLVGLNGKNVSIDLPPRPVREKQAA